MSSRPEVIANQPHLKAISTFPNNRPRPGFNRGRYQDQTRVNDRIRSPKVRVIDGPSGQQLGVLPTGQALRLAKERGLDLVEISASADPPVCKIVDYGKYKYEQEKKKKESAKAQKGGKLKELKFRVGIDPHDYLIKLSHAEEFLGEGNKVRIQLQFKGRQMAHQEIGFQLAKRIRDDLNTMGTLDQDPKMAGRNINMQITPLPEKQRVRKLANFKHGKFINPEEEDNEHEEHHEGDHHDDHHDDAPAAPVAETAVAAVKAVTADVAAVAAQALTSVAAALTSAAEAVAPAPAEPKPAKEKSAAKAK